MKSKIIGILKYSTRIMENENHTDYLIDNIDEVAEEIVKLFSISAVSIMCECSDKSNNHVGPFYKECGKCGKQIK